MNSIEDNYEKNEETIQNNCWLRNKSKTPVPLKKLHLE